MLLLTTLSACAGLRPESSAKSIKLPAACQNLAKSVGLPKSAVSGKDLGVVAAENRAAAVLANRRLDEVRKCEAAVRARYGNGR